MLPKIHKVRRPHPAFISLAFMGFPFPIQAGGLHTQAAPPMSAVPTYPRDFPHMPAPFSHTFPRLPQPHAPAQIPIGSAGFPYVSADPPYDHQAPKISTLIPTRPAFPAPQTRHPRVSTNSLRRLPARYRMSRRSIKSAETSGRLTQTCASNRFTQIPCTNDEEAGAMAWRRFATRRRRRSGDLHSSPPEGGLLRRGSPRNRNRLDSTKARRRGAGSAGRIAQVRRHACATPLGYRASTFSSISSKSSFVSF